MIHRLLRVTSVRSQNPRGFGGSIFTGKSISGADESPEAPSYFVVIATGDVLGNAIVQFGQWWQVSGSEDSRVRELNGYTVTEHQITANTAYLALPCGEHLVCFLAESAAFQGIGTVKARKLWERFGERLYDLLNSGDVVALSTVVSRDVAITAVSAWAEQGDDRLLQLMQAEGIDRRIGQRALQYFGSEVLTKLANDPYRLLSFCGSWRQVDRFAQAHFGVRPDDERRLKAAVEEALNRRFELGHTTALSGAVMDQLATLLGPSLGTGSWRTLVGKALNTGLTNGGFVMGHHGLQALGAFVMERQVAKAVISRLSARKDCLLSRAAIESVLQAHEAAENIVLNDEQRQAVHLASSEAIAVITGGAGVGKTTVLKALLRVCSSASIQLLQVALSGRAAQRLQEVTGCSASTIEKFLRDPPTFASRSVLVIDEASMVDLITMSRLCQLLPTQVRIILVGDPSQLMPVGPGLVLHALVCIPEIPSVELKTAKRFGGEIHAAAAAVRAGMWPLLSSDAGGPISFMQQKSGDLIASTVLELYRVSPARTKILCARRRGHDGVIHLNEMCQGKMNSEAEPMLSWSDSEGSLVRTGLRLGDPVLCTKNIRDQSLHNGSQGVLARICKQADWGARLGEDDPILGWINWDDGETRPVFGSLLENLTLGYAITVHKAQGSQWQRVIVPLTGHRLLDRSLIYTAMTRGEQQVVFVGDEDAVSKAVIDAPAAQRRQVALDLHVRDMLQAAGIRFLSDAGRDSQDLARRV